MICIEKIIKDIRSLKIQGANAVTHSALEALYLQSSSSKAITKSVFLSELDQLKEALFKSRPTEPCMRNAVHYVLDKLDGLDVYHLKKQCDHRIRDAKEHFESAEKAISSIGAKKITNNMIVYTHCHSSTVVNILKQAKLEGKRFVVHNTETRPLLQGRKTAKELAKAKIPVIHFVDSAARLALKKADIVLLGADAITSEGKVINKIGSELIAEAAYHLRIPVYICTDSWKFDPNTIFGYEEEIEQRSGKEVWDSPPKGVHIDNHAFERIHPALISAIISEFGVYRPTVFVEEMRRNYRWMFN